MKDQYFGDVNDYRKYGLLRALRDAARVRIGVCWMLTPNDERADGQFISYLSHPKRWRNYDPPLFDALSACVSQRQRAVAQADRPDILGGMPCIDVLLPDDRVGRQSYFVNAAQRLSRCDLVFFDPDNGLEIESCPIGSRSAIKYLYWCEVEAWFARGQSLLIYQHFPRERREVYIDRRALELRQRTRTAEVIALRTPHVVFFLVPQPAHRAQISAALPTVTARWCPQIRLTNYA